MAWLRLIRWKNLLIIFLTQLLAWGCVILPENPVILVPVNFLLLGISTVLIAAAGYMINDYFDIKIDMVNHPDKVVLEKMIPRKQAIIYHTILNLIALLLAGIVAVQAHHLSLLLIQISVTLLLWFYSTHFKRMFMIGNVIVALLSAFTVLTLILYEPVMKTNIGNGPFNRHNSDSDQLGINAIWMLFVYAFFAFILTWMREVVKDMEDLIGDMTEGCTTLPVKWGIAGAMRFVNTLGTGTLLVLLYLGASTFLLTNAPLLGAYLVLLAILLAAWMLNFIKRISTEHFHKSSSGIKLIMLAGIISLIVYHFTACTK